MNIEIQEIKYVKLKDIIYELRKIKKVTEYYEKDRRTYRAKYMILNNKLLNCIINLENILKKTK